jgi:LemA protein
MLAQAPTLAIYSRVEGRASSSVLKRRMPSNMLRSVSRVDFVRSARLLVVTVAAMSLAACGFNSVPTKQEAAKAKWADVQAAFQERANLVPNLAAVAKGAAEQEKAILTGVVEARAKATSVQVTANDLSDPAKMQQYSQAQEQFGQSLGRLLVSVEKYPDLKSITNYQMLQSQIEGQENRIRVAVRDYNGAVQDYNTEVRVFPTMIGAKLRGASPLVPYQAVTPGAEVAPSLEGKL